MTINSCI